MVTCSISSWHQQFVNLFEKLCVLPFNLCERMDWEAISEVVYLSPWHKAQVFICVSGIYFDETLQ